MTTRLPIAKKYQPYARAARRGGATLVRGSKHLKIYDGPELVAVLPYGTHQYEGRGDLKMLTKLWAAHGWTP